MTSIEDLGAAMPAAAQNGQPDFEMKFDLGTIKHLGLRMYSTLPPVIGELVSNAWDADAERVDINIPGGFLNAQSEIIVVDNGDGMTDDQVRNAYLIVGRDRRDEEGDQPTARHGRPLMGRKGIGKFSPFGIAGEVELETVRAGQTSRFIMNYQDLVRAGAARAIQMPALPPTGTVAQGTKVTLRRIEKYRTRSVPVQALRRLLARRFSIFGERNFHVYVNGAEITAADRDLKRLLERDRAGEPYLWEINEEIQPDSGWHVSGWIGALDRTKEVEETIQRGVSIMARGKLVQEPFVFDAVVGQQFALSYLVGELHAEFVDAGEDTVGTTRSSLVWDTDANQALKSWGQRTVNRIAREWAERRSVDNEAELVQDPLYQRFLEEADQIDDKPTKRLADKLIRQVVKQNIVGGPNEQKQVIELCIDFLQFDSFKDLAQDILETEDVDVGRLVGLFRDWEVLEAKEMMKVTEGRIATIERLQHLIETNALEVPILHNFLKEFPWVIDPRWSLVQDEVRFSDILRQKFPDEDLPVEERRIDFLCVAEADHLVVVEIKRPQLKASLKELAQLETYVGFMRYTTTKTTDPALRIAHVSGYLLCGDVVNTWEVQQRKDNLEKNSMYVRPYADLLRMVRTVHAEFLERYNRLRAARRAPAAAPVPAPASPSSA